ncbi:hypothetical protein MSAN_02403300 [Mycena sanguinolenta]|uniref:Uncharacterized protein n=1 Tax=Mycena sanguinolenta TaxID=230812 RepID=A0A8H6X4C4_9AGAR|nr:hypothetical protein MSAN_02403300 [Mycena sanguinolenta]
MFLRILHAEQQYKKVEEYVIGIQKQLDAVVQFCTESWKPSEEQKKLLKSLLRHYIIRPITSYGDLVKIVESYIFDHAKQLRLGLYRDNPTVKSVIHELLMKENGALRSAVRKLVWASVEKNSVDDFTKTIIDLYHFPTNPATLPNDIMACMAPMHKVAKPLTNKESTRGGDTGFWKELEQELYTLFEKNGNERDSVKWRQWEQEIMREDNRIYNHYAATSSSRAQQEIDAALLSSGRGAGAAVGDEDVDDDSMAHEDREVHISGLGNLAALAAGPVVRSEEQ